MHGQWPGHTLTIGCIKKAFTNPVDLLTILEPEEINITLSLLRRVKTNVSQVHSRVKGHMVKG